MNNPIIQNIKGPIIGYKAFKKDNKGLYTDGLGKGKKIYWKKGDRKKIKENPILCENGFHFFDNLCFAINYLKKDNEIYKITAHDNIIKDTFKLVTNDIEINKKITKKEIKKIIKSYRNSGYRNSGDCNSGNRNSGDCNSGDFNSGYRNSGDCNSGNFNSGNYNSGYYNSGNYNSGNRNSGNLNSGYRNSGNRNSGDRNSGYYNSGYYNSGNLNSGNLNSGNFNSGYCNSGYRNSGNRNSGNFNSGNFNSGNFNSGNGYINFFCTKKRYFLFDIEINEIPEKLKNLDMSWFIFDNNNNNNNNNNNKDNYIKTWGKCPNNILNILRKIPEFQIEENKIKFKEITGLDL